VRGKAHSDDTKARVIAALLAGCGVVEIAREMKLPHNTVSDYKKEIPEEKFDELRRKKGERLDDLVYDYLVQNLETLRAQSKAVSDASYINEQPAGEMATLHGVIADKTIRLLEVTTSHSSPSQQLNPAPESDT
jgi:transposase-like protein